MARIQLSYPGYGLASIDMIAPQYGDSPRDAQLKREDYYAGKLPVLWLLHGGMGCSSDWLRFTEVERFAAEKRLFAVEVGAVLHRRAAQGLSIHLHAVDVLGLAVQIVKFGLVEVRLRALPAKDALRRRFLRRRSILVGRFLHFTVLAGMLRAPARGDVVLHAMEEANEGIKGVRILIFLFRELRFVVRRDLLVHRGGFIEIFLGDEILCGPGAILPARGLGRIGLLRRALRLNRLGGGGFNRPGRLRRLRSLHRLHRLARAGLVLLVSATELVVIQFRAVVSGIAHSVTASHCTKRMRGISIRFYYIKIPFF